MNETLSKIMEIIVELLDAHICEHRNVHDRPSLEECHNYIKNKSVTKLIEVLKSEGISYYIMEKIMLDKFHEMRCNELFDIVKAFAAGENVQYAIEDMKRCTESLKHKENMIQSLLRDFKSRLLHSSVGTSGIIIYSLSLKMVLDIIDPMSHVLNAMINPVKDYLRWRKDLNKCVLHTILNKETCIVGTNRARPDAEAESIAEFDTWVPDAIDAIGNANDQRSDTIEFLVKLLESPSKLFEEYANHMALTLLNKNTMNTNDECIELELLMNQFGESNFINCRVMLMDVSTSLCLSNEFSDEHKKGTSINIEITPIIFSYYSWPPLDNLPIKLPAQLKLLRDEFDEWHYKGRSNKYLVWLFGNGVIELEIVIGETVLFFRVSELDALVISFFNDIYEDISLEYIFDHLVAPNNDHPKISRQNSILPQQLYQYIQNSLNKWVSRGLLMKKSPNLYSAVTTYDGQNQVNNSLDKYSSLPTEVTNVCDEFEIAPLNQTVDDYNGSDSFVKNIPPQDEEFYKRIVTGMLANHGPTKIELIHSRMCMFINYSKPIPILKAFLNKLHLKGVVFKNADDAYYV